ETGLPIDAYREQNRLCRSFGMRTGAFLASHREPRGPLGEGLPTVEAHRRLPTAKAAVELLEGGLIDFIYFGDPGPSENDWNCAVQVVAEQGPIEIESYPRGECVRQASRNDRQQPVDQSEGPVIELRVRWSEPLPAAMEPFFA